VLLIRCFMFESKKIHRRDKVKNVEFEERVISVSRVVKVVKGGRIFSFSTLVVIGNKCGYFGIGLGKALEVSDAKRKAINDAKNNLYFVCLTKAKTVPHVVEAKFGATKVLARPAKPGTGIIAGNAMRMVCECVGIKDIVAKVIGSSNPHNVAKATRDALMQLKSSKYYTVVLGQKHQVSQTAIADESDSDNEFSE